MGKTSLALAVCGALLFGGCAAAPPLPRPPEAPGMAAPLITPAPTPQPTPSPTPTPVPTPAPPEATPGYRPPDGAFQPEDLTMRGIAAGVGMDAVVAVLGLPPHSEEETEEVTGARYMTLDYEGLYIGLRGGSTPSSLAIHSMTITTDKWEAPRGVRVGDALEEVLAAFSLSMPEEEEGEEGSLTLYADAREDGGALPPLAELSRDVSENGAYVLRCIAPLRPYTDGEREGSGYFAQQHAVCTFYFDAKKDTLVRVHWFVGPLAE